MQLLPRRCPLCGDETIIGHGQRRKQAHDPCHDWIWVRRGICHPCSKTFTILPDWLAPSAHFSLRCRQQACEHIAAGDSVASKKPAPDIYFLALEQLGFGPDCCVAIEDSTNGVLAARAAGLPVIACPSSYLRGDDFGRATAVLSDLGEPDCGFRHIAGRPFERN